MRHMLTQTPLKLALDIRHMLTKTPLKLALDIRYMLRVYLILLICLSAVSGLCSTCLEERCHDNGECIIGCVPDYVGSYCEQRCPTTCLNNDCYIDRIRGTVTCTDGCEPGYCGIKCSYKCPDGCVTCDRQCGSCNTTLCPEGRYTTECRKAVQCSPRYEKCDRETGQCIRCRRGYFGDECTRKCRACFTKEDHITDGCLSGCEQCKTEETCTPGFHGERCEDRCSEGCQQSDNDSRRPCNRATGECSAGCVSGYHGLTCNNTCNRYCVDGICNQHNGVCTSGCIDGYEKKLHFCEKLSDTEENVDASRSTAHVIIVLLICLLVCLTCVICFGCCWVRQRQRSERKKAAKYEHGQTVDENGRFLNAKTQVSKNVSLDDSSCFSHTR